MNKILSILTITISFSELFGQPKPKLIYIVDPLCSWCYGFQVEMDQVIEKYQDNCEIEILVGGMGIDQSKPIDQEFKESLKGHWSQVKKETGQQFDYNILNSKNLVYNSEPICRAIVTVKTIDSTKALSAYKLFQSSFYSKVKDITQINQINKCVHQLGIDTSVFTQKYLSLEMKRKTQDEFDRVENNGVNSYPVLIFTNDRKAVLISNGYMKYKKLVKKINKELSKN